MEEGWNAIGNYYSERHKFTEAAQFYERGRNTEKLVNCYYAIEDFDNLENLLDSLQPDDPLLHTLGNMFSSVGLGPQAVEVYVKCGKVSKAIDICVNLNQWHEAVELASKHDQPNKISSLLAKYAKHLLDDNKTLQAIELYRKANHFLEAAKLLTDIAEKETVKRSSPLKIKKIYVLSALLVESYLKKNIQTGSKSSALMGLLLNADDSTGDVGIVDKAWRGAEAYHFLMLAQRQLYAGSVDDAMKTCLHLRTFDDILNEEDIYSLLALSSCANRAFGTCSRAFIKLESIEEELGNSNDYGELAMDIFTKHGPKDTRSNRAECANCETMIPDWVNTCPSCQTKFPTCIVTGRPLMNLSKVWSCNTCHHQAYEEDITMKRNCPLCHFLIRV
uniref:Uncharacterized protein n=3 Tax=Lepeophtheirus salmonis TaxID=72036 RepID=A0A0K2VJ26_LEPSM